MEMLFTHGHYKNNSGQVKIAFILLVVFSLFVFTNEGERMAIFYLNRGFQAAEKSMLW